MLRCLTVIAMLGLGACVSGGSEPPLLDAQHNGNGDGGGNGGGDGGGGDATLSLDGGTAATCTGKAYDSCTTGSQCMSNNCKLFSQANITVCTQACSATVPCPPQNGQPVPCNNMGVCRPNAANACTAP